LRKLGLVVLHLAHVHATQRDHLRGCRVDCLDAAHHLPGSVLGAPNFKRLNGLKGGGYVAVDADLREAEALVCLFDCAEINECVVAYMELRGTSRTIIADPSRHNGITFLEELGGS